MTRSNNCPIRNRPNGQEHGCPRCVVCNQVLREGASHRCPTRVLAGREAAARRVDNQYDPTRPELPPVPGGMPSYDDRLTMGFRMLGGMA